MSKNLMSKKKRLEKEIVKSQSYHNILLQKMKLITFPK